MTEMICFVLGGFLIPMQHCVSCGMPVGKSVARFSIGAAGNKQSLSIAFPLCGECDASRQRVGKVKQKRKMWSGIIALPIGIVGYFVYHLIAGRDTLSWFGTVAIENISCAVWYGMLLGWFLAYLAIYNLFGDKLTKDTIDPHDQEVDAKVKSSVKLTGFQPARGFNKNGSVTIHFENVLYAMEFRLANFMKITNMSE